MNNAGVWAVLGVLGAACGGQPAVPEVAQAPEKFPAASAEHCGRSQAARAVSPLETEAGSTIALARHGKQLLAYVSDSDEQAVHVVDVDTGKKLSSTPLSGTPSQLMFMTDGRLIVGLRDRAKLVVLEPGDPRKPLARRCGVDTAAEPVGLAQTPGGDTVLVANAWSAELGAYASSDFALRFSVPLDRAPRSVLVADDGKSAFVSHASGGRVSRVALDSRKVVAIELSAQPSKEVETRIEESFSHFKRMPAQDDKVIAAQKQQLLRQFGIGTRRGNQGFALAKSSSLEGRVFSPNALVEPGDPKQRSAGYGTEHQQSVVANIAVIDVRASRAMKSSLVVPSPWALRSFKDEKTTPCLLPRAATVDAASDTLLVSCVGIDAVVAYDAASANPITSEKGRWRVPAGPTGIAMDAERGRAVVWSQFDRSVSVIKVGDHELTGLEDELRVREIALAPNPRRKLPVALALGRILFHATGDARIASDGRACASCHPDGLDDGLTWSTPNGPRRTKLLAGSIAGTAPYAWDGGGHDLEDHLTDTFRRLNGAGGLRSLELDSLVAYLQSLKPPARDERADTAAVARGRKLFHSEQTACATCHSGSRFTDNSKHDVKSKHESDRSADFDTPPLVSLAGKAPYFHDGRYESLEQLLVDSDGKMGKTKHLSPKQRGDLVAFLETL